MGFNLFNLFNGFSTFHQPEIPFPAVLTGKRIVRVPFREVVNYRAGVAIPDNTLSFPVDDQVYSL